MTHAALGLGGAMLARIVTSSVVFVLWSYPVWKRIFQPSGALLVAPEEG